MESAGAGRFLQEGFMAKVLRGDFSPKQAVPGARRSAQEQVPGYRLKLAVAFSDPLIWRTLEVPGNFTLAKLHEVIQICMGWDDSDTHQFLVGKIFYQSGFGIKDTKQEPQYDENNFELHQLEEGMQFLFTYLYDGGEGWELEITLQQTIPAGLKDDSPVLLDGERACPPAEIGDIHRYQLLLADAEKRDDGSPVRFDIATISDFNPAQFDMASVAERLAAITGSN